MASIAKANKAAIAKAAGVTGTETSVPADKFKLVTSQSAGGLSAGDTISTKKQAVLYFRALLNEDMEEGKEVALSDDQIWQGIKQFDQGDLEPVDVDQGILNYLNDLASSSDKPLTTEQERALSENELWASAVLDGQSATPELEAKLDETIEGKKIWDGGPIVLEAQLVKDYGDKMKRWPPIGTRLTGKTNKKGQSTDVLPYAGYNGNTDYFKVELPGNDPVIRRWLQGFVENMPHVAPFIVERKTVKALMDNNVLAIVPKKYAPYVPTKENGLLQINGPALQGFYDDLTGEITKRVNRIGQAIMFWQAKQQLKEHLPKVTFQLVDGTPEATAKRGKPIQMISIVPNPNDPTGMPGMMAEPKPIALSRFIKHGKNARVCALQKGGMAMLNTMATAKKKPTPPTTTGVATQATSYKIENVDAMSSSLANLYDYVKHHETMIKDKIKDTATGAEFCSWLMSAYEALEAIIESDAAMFDLIKARAKAYDQQQTAAVNAALKKVDAGKVVKAA